jgi:hypothetical protein
MKVRVYFCKEPDIEIIIKGNKIGRQALVTIYDLVWECEFKNIVNVGRVWLKFKEENKPFGMSLRNKRTLVRSLQEILFRLIKRTIWLIQLVPEK